MSGQILLSHVVYPALLLLALNYPLLRLYKRAAWQRFALGAIVSLNALFICLFVLEIGMQLFYCQSDGYDLTFASKKWFAKYWKPINELGYRDGPHVKPGEGVKTVFVLGDSFVAGHGIENYEDRFANLLGAKLGPGYKVMAVGQNGWDTPEEYQALISHPVTPDIVILSYFINDIIKAARGVGFKMPFDVRMPGNFLTKYLVNNYALINFAYWRLLRIGNSDNAANSFWDLLRAAYADEKSWQAHAAELQKIIDFCGQKNIPLYAVIFPHLQDIEGSQVITGKVAGYLRAAGVKVVEVSNLVKGRPGKDLVVNVWDAHANQAVQKEVTDALFTCLQKGECR